MMAIEQAVLLFCSLTLNILRPQKETEWTLSTICETGDFLKKKIKVWIYYMQLSHSSSTYIP